MFGLGMPEILMILAIALIVIGPKKLPGLAKTLGRAMGEFKRSAQDFKRSIDVESSIKDMDDIDVPSADLEGIIKDVNTKDESSAETKEDPAEKKDNQNISDDTEDNAEEPPADNESKKSENTSEDNKSSI